MNGGIDIKHCLNIKYGEIDQQIVLNNDIYSIGRHSSNKIVINSETISRFHCTILPVKYQGQNNQQLFWIIDGDLQGNRSSNGIYVNNNKCLSHELKAGDIIKVGGNEVEIAYLHFDESKNTESKIISSDSHINQNGDRFFGSNNSEEIFESTLNTTIIEKDKEEEDFFIHELLFILKDKQKKVQIPSFTTNLVGEIISYNDKYQQLFPQLQQKSFKINPFYNRDCGTVT